eukprot:gene1462-1698_t
MSRQDKVKQTQGQVNEVTGIMHNTISTMLDNQQKVSELQSKSTLVHNPIPARMSKRVSTIRQLFIPSV